MSQNLRGHREGLRTCAGVLAAVLIITLGLIGCAYAAAEGVAIGNASLTGTGDASLYVSIVDSANRPIRGLSTANFQASVSGEPVECSVRPTDDGSPLTIIMAVDTSLSLAGAPMKSVKEGAAAFLDQLGKQDSVCLVSFSQGVIVAADFTRDHDQLKGAIQGLDAKGANTLLYQALVRCSQQCALAPSSRCAVVLLTDGKDEGSSIPLQQAIEEARKSGVPFYTLGYGSEASNVVLERISGLTGGRFRRISRPDQIVSFYREIAQELKNQYVVHVKGPFDAGNRIFAVGVTIKGRTTNAEHRIFVPAAPTKSAARTIAWLLAICLLSAIVAVAIRRSRRLDNSAEWGDEEGRDDMVIGERSMEGWSPVDTSSFDYTSTSTTNAQAWVEVVKGPHRGARFILTGRPVRIGRGTESDLSLERDAAVSRLHSEITFSNSGEFVLRDMGSQNGTRIEGNQLNGRSVRLRDGDRISLGASELIYRDERLRHKTR